MGWINNQEVLGKLRQVMNEVLELKAEESARSKEMIKQMDALNEKMGFLSAKMSEANAKIAGLNTRVDDLNQHAGTLEGFIKNGATKPMMEMLGKKVNEIGKTVNDHFESFVKVSETDSELFKLIAQALTGKVMEEEASAEPKLTEKAKKNERRKTKKNEGAKEAEKTVSGTDGDGGKERKTVVVFGKYGASDEERKNLPKPEKETKGFVSLNKNARAILISANMFCRLKELGFTHLISFLRDEIHPTVFWLVFGKNKIGQKMCKDQRIYNPKIAKALCDSAGGDAKVRFFAALYDSSKVETCMLGIATQRKLNKKRSNDL